MTSVHLLSHFHLLQSLNFVLAIFVDKKTIPTSKSIDTVHVILTNQAKLANEDLSFYIPWITVILASITIILTVFGYLINKRGALLQKNQWHSQLFRQFYVEDTYKEMRYILDFKPQDKIDQLKAALQPGSSDKISEPFYDYLNFFEFIASMWKAKQIEYDEILNLFKYYLVILNKESFVRDKIDRMGFEFLNTLLSEMEKKGEHH